MEKWKVIYETPEGDDWIIVESNEIQIDANDERAVIADGVRINFEMSVKSVEKEIAG